MKATEKVLDVLSLPVVAAIAASVLAAWSIKELREYSGYGLPVAGWDDQQRRLMDSP